MSVGSFASSSCGSVSGGAGSEESGMRPFRAGEEWKALAVEKMALLRFAVMAALDGNPEYLIGDWTVENGVPCC